MEKGKKKIQASRDFKPVPWEWGDYVTFSASLPVHFETHRYGKKCK